MLTMYIQTTTKTILTTALRIFALVCKPCGHLAPKDECHLRLMCLIISRTKFLQLVLGLLAMHCIAGLHLCPRLFALQALLYSVNILAFTVLDWRLVWSLWLHGASPSILSSRSVKVGFLKRTLLSCEC